MRHKIYNSVISLIANLCGGCYIRIIVIVKQRYFVLRVLFEFECFTKLISYTKMFIIHSFEHIFVPVLTVSPSIR
jgi:hypothetical protein